MEFKQAENIAEKNVQHIIVTALEGCSVCKDIIATHRMLVACFETTAEVLFCCSVEDYIKKYPDRDPEAGKV